MIHTLRKRIFPLLKNRYLLAAVFTLVWMLYFDRYDWFSQGKFFLEIRALQKDKEFYLKEIDRLKAEKATITEDNLPENHI